MKLLDTLVNIDTDNYKPYIILYTKPAYTQSYLYYPLPLLYIIAIIKPLLKD